MGYVTGKTVKELREKKKLTQKQLADILQISDKTISKWETDRGLPDIGLICGLAEALGVSVAEILMGEVAENNNRSANMKKVQFYVCPICGNVIQTIGKGSYSCCGIMLPVVEVEDDNETHQIQVEVVDNEYYVYMDHPMTKDHYISFIVYVTSNHSEFIKLYPEQNVECRFAKRGRGIFYVFCNKHGLNKSSI